MIKVYSYTKINRPTRQTTDWLTSHNIDFSLITKNDLTINLIMEMLQVSENGFEDILISENRSKIYKEKKVFSSVERLSTNELYENILTYPEVLREPIVFSDNKMVIGYNSEEIRKFLPRFRKEKPC